MAYPIWMLICYESKTPLKPKADKGGTVLVLIDATGKSSVEIYVMDNPLRPADKRVIKAEAEGSKFRDYATIFYPQRHRDEIITILKDVFPSGQIQDFLDDQVVKEKTQRFIDSISNLVQEVPNVDDISFSVQLFAQKDDNHDEPEPHMTVKQLVVEFWQNDPHLRKTMLHAYLLGRSTTLRHLSAYPEIKRRIGENPTRFEAYTQMLENAKVFILGKICKLREDNGAMEAVEEQIKKMYDIDQNIGGIDGSEFLNLAYDGRRGQSRRFSNAIKTVLLQGLPQLRCIEIRTYPYIFELFHPGKWFIVFACSSSASPLGDSIVTLVRGHTDKLNKSFVMRSAFAVVVGPTFSKDAISMAEVNGVHLFESGDLLNLSKYISSLTDLDRETIYDYFPIIFSRGSGLVNIQEEIENVKRIMED